MNSKNYERTTKKSMVMLDIAVNLMKHKCAERTSLLRRFINLFKKH